MIEWKKIMELHLFVLLKRKIYFWRSRFRAAVRRGHTRPEKMESLYKWYVICCYSLLSTSGGRGHLAGILPQIWPHSAGLGAPLVYQESWKPETTPEEAFSRALKIEKLKATLFPGPEGYKWLVHNASQRHLWSFPLAFLTLFSCKNSNKSFEILLQVS